MILMWKGFLYMSPKRIKQRFKNFSDALDRLRDVLNHDMDDSQLIIDATIKRFEFTFELGWKLLKDVLDFNGINTALPRDIIKEAFQKELIFDGDGWLKALDDRNQSVHIYDEKQVLRIFSRVKDNHFELFDALKIVIVEMIDSMDKE